MLDIKKMFIIELRALILDVKKMFITELRVLLDIIKYLPTYTFLSQE